MIAVGELAGHTHTRGTMNIIGSFTGRPHTSAGNYGGALTTTTSGAFAHTIRGGTASHSGTAESGTKSKEDIVTFDASKSWSGETSSTGSDTKHNTVPAYIACYAYKRTK